MHMALLPTTLYGYSFYHFDMDRGIVFVNIKVITLGGGFIP